MFHIFPQTLFFNQLEQGAYGHVLEVYTVKCCRIQKLYAAKKYRFSAFKAFGQEHEMTRICFHRNVV